MPGYRPIGVVARHLHVPESDIEGMVSKGWLEAVEKNGIRFLTSHQEYRARFILDLRKRKALSDSQISYVLSEQEPPYSFQQVDSILARYKDRSPRDS